MAYRQEHFKGEGVPYIDGLDVGQCTSAVVGITTTSNKIKSKRGGGGDLYSEEKFEGADLSMTLHDIKKENLALLLRASTSDLAAVSFTDVEVEASAGFLIDLDRIADISDVQVKIGAAAYRAAVEGTDFVRAYQGDLVASVDGTFKLSGTYPATERIEALTEASAEHYVKLVFNNELISGQRVTLRAHKVTFAPVASLDLMNDTYVSLELKGTILADTSQLAGLSQFFVINKTTRV